MDHILIIDGLNYIHRGIIKFGNNQINDDYVLVYNFFRNIRASVEQFKPTKVFFCLEGRAEHRYKLLPSYKENRIVKYAAKSRHEHDKFDRQRDAIIALLGCLPIIKVSAAKYEADDTIATLADNMSDECITILSNDTDLIQLLQKGYPKLKLYNSFKKTYIEPPECFYLTLKSLMGDKSDSIPGIVGPKKAEALSKDPGALQEFLSVEENRANYKLNLDLISLHIIPDDELQFQDYNVDYNKLHEEFRRMEFKTMIEPKYWQRFKDTFQNLH